MPIARPLARGPVGSRAARPRRPVTAPLALAGVIPVLLALLLYELPLFEGSGECTCRADAWSPPGAHHGQDLEIAPVVRVGPDRVSLDHRTMRGDADLIADLEVLRRNWAVLRPGAPFVGRIVVEAHPRVPYRAVRRVTRAAARAGYPHVSVAVRASR